jgi:hypothetical protein
MPPQSDPVHVAIACVIVASAVAKSTCLDAPCWMEKLMHGCRHWSVIPQSPAIAGVHTCPAVDPVGPGGHAADWQNALAARDPKSAARAAARARARRMGL